MMKNIRLAGAITLLTLIATISCKRTLYIHPNDSPPSYYLPLEVGKYAIYRVDSLNFYFYGQLDTLTHYLAKDSVEGSFTDPLGHTSWMVIRYLSPATGPTVWTTSATNVVTPSSRSLELSENNLRFIKLAYPIKDSLTWDGNGYIPGKPYQGIFDFAAPPNTDLNEWTYIYRNVNQPYTAGGTAYDSTVTILQEDDSNNVDGHIIIDTAFAYRTYWQETYAKNIGLVYRHTVMWEYQPPVPRTSQAGYKIGFEVTFTLLEHN